MQTNCSGRIRLLIRYNVITTSILSALWVGVTICFPNVFVYLFMSPTHIIIDIKSKEEYTHLIGLTEDNIILSNDECLNILKMPILECIEDGTRSPSWLKQSTNLITHDILDNYLDIENIISTPASRTSNASFNLKKESEIITLEQDLKNLEGELLKVQSDKMQKLALTRKINKLKTSIIYLKASSSIPVPVPVSQHISNINPNIKVMREFLVYIN